MSKLQILFRRLAWTTVALTLVLVMLGAYVRLTDAGLGCPDWPGCYGELLWPKDAETIAAANEAFPERPVDIGKAWREMVHRYLAIIVGMLVIAMVVISAMLRGIPGTPWKACIGLLALILFQGGLGAATVLFLVKPAIVTAHLLGGLATLGLLVWIAVSATRHVRFRMPPGLKKIWTMAFAILILQVFLGGWVSTNYAAVACGTEFPTCHQSYWPDDMDFAEGFDLWHELGVDYEFGILESPARTAIHVTHRYMAIIASIALLVLASALWRQGDLVARRMAVAVVLALGLQLSLGVINIVAALPLWAAVAHNGGAALLVSLLLAQRAMARDDQHPA
jgi:cytochrome c oxidase assembly protein subunit 15